MSQPYDTPPADPDIALEDAEPVVASTRPAVSPAITVACFGVAAILLFLVLNGRRVERLDGPAASQAEQPQSAAWTPPPLDLPATQISTAEAGPFTGLPTQVMIAPTPVLAPLSAGPAFVGPATVIATSDMSQRRRAPSVVVDLGGAPRESGGALTAGAAGVAAAGAATDTGAQAQRPQLNDSEQFAKRIGDEEPDRARATTMRNLDSIAPQGTVIPGVLETAINSDLPGFTRAVVSRDVLSFDGKSVLIPRSSRLIGQYKSAVALGQSRAFIIWTRIIRPDGVTIQIGSPGTDALGRGGLAGEVNRHFFRRFSGAILLSVLNAGVASVGSTPSTQISIGSSGAAAGLASSALQGEAIPPTIKVAQGEAISIFVARDLDFSGVATLR